MDPDGNMAYWIDANKLNGVIGAQWPEEWNGFSARIQFIHRGYGKSEIPTAEVNGQLSMGVITSNDLSGTLIGKTVY